MQFLSHTPNFIEINNYGIDGPAPLINLEELDKPPLSVIKIIEKSNFVFSDNTLWAFRYNSNFSLFGHFNWLDYWLIVGLNSLKPKFRSIFDLELESLARIKTNFVYESFEIEHKLKSSQLPSNPIPLKLVRYTSDNFLPKTKSKKPYIWVSSGTTGIMANQVLQIKKLQVKKIKVIKMESYKLLYAKQKPWLIMGRPGVGTIRDCLASGTLFYPINFHGDPELTSNVKSLVNLSLLTSNVFENGTLDDKIDQVMHEKKLIFNWENSWDSVSENIDVICEQIMSIIG